ncbi:glycosyltransferase BC10-like isoform X2 [Tasmannia lanceolata]|uniref:glycosyltransferase BC10-like isoform X2 n=1 Tax=Tasmannia lanceolata TaxID=3420 RepID=UPI0040636FA7
MLFPFQRLCFIDLIFAILSVFQTSLLAMIAVEKILKRINKSVKLEKYQHSIPLVQVTFFILRDLLGNRRRHFADGLLHVRAATQAQMNYVICKNNLLVNFANLQSICDQYMERVVQWGYFSMIEAERRLLANALLDFSNQHFVLLSESCIPLFNFSTIYAYITNSTVNFVHAFEEPRHNRYNIHMKPQINLYQWRKGSQWFEIDRDLALEIISDHQLFPVFKKFCNSSCYVDEHYIPTFVSMRFGERNSNRSLTWVDWSKRRAHPGKFGRGDVTIEVLERMRNGSECKYNGRITRVCFLFARKFLPDSLDMLMRFAPKVMGFN